MELPQSTLARACALALSLGALQACDNGDKLTVGNATLGDNNEPYVGIVAPSGADGQGTDGGDNGDGNGDGTGGGGNGDGTDGGDTGGGNGDGTDGGDTGGGNGDGTDGGDTGGGNGDGTDGGDTGGGNGDGTDGGDTGGGNGDGTDGGDNGGGNGDGTDGGDTGGDNGDGTDGGDTGGGNGGGTDGGDNGGDNGDGTDGGDTDGEGTDQNSSAAALANDLLQYSASSANVNRFAYALANGNGAIGAGNCADAGKVSINTVGGSESPNWTFYHCSLPSADGENVIYNGTISIACTRARTTNAAANNCTLNYSQFKAVQGELSVLLDGEASLIAENEHLRTDSANLHTTVGHDTWSSQAQMIASDQGTLAGLSTHIGSSEQDIDLSVSGDSEFRQSAAGCLEAGTLTVNNAKDSSASFTVSAQVGGNMVVKSATHSDTLACSEVTALPYTEPKFH